MTPITRAYEKKENVAVSASVASCDPIDRRGYAGLSVRIPSGSSVTSLQVYTGASDDDTFQPWHDDDGATVSITVAADGDYPLPTNIWRAPPFLKLVANATGTITVYPIS